MYIWWIDFSIRRPISSCGSKDNSQYQIHFPFSRVFFGENCVWSLCFLSGAQSCSLDIPGKNTSWITSIWSPIWEEIDGTLEGPRNLYWKSYWAMKYLDLRSSRPQNIFRKICKTLRSPCYMLNVHSLSTSSLPTNLISVSFKP